MGYGVRDLIFRSDKSERARLEAFLDASPRYPTILMRRAAADLDAFGGFWPAALEGGLELRALAAVENGVTLTYGELPAIEALAGHMARRVLNRPAESGTYQLVGDERVIEVWWRVFSRVEGARTVAMDRRRHLYGTTQPAEPPKPDLAVGPASLADLKVVYAFVGEHAVEEWGFDPRRITPQSHEAACRAAIEGGRQLIGRDRGRPVFVAELSPVHDGARFLEKVHVPRPFRVRKRMVASALAKAALFACEGESEALLFVDADDAPTNSSAEMAGFAVKRTFRRIVMRS
jgi:hypothetical protein